MTTTDHLSPIGKLMLARHAQPATGTVLVPMSHTDVDACEATDCEITERLERIDIGGAGPLADTYLRIEATDLVAWAGSVTDLMLKVIDAVLDRRQELAEAERHDCFCGTRLDPEEITCGSMACNRLAAAEHRVEAYT